jgi:beta-galactosidase
VDVWAYTNCEEVELYLNGASKGIRRKQGDDLHLAWRIPYCPGTLKAVGRTGGKETLIREVKTAGTPTKIVLDPDRSVIAADGKDLSFVSVRVLDTAGMLVPDASNLIHFNITGGGTIVGVDNGLQTSLEPFKANTRRAFNGLCLVVVQSNRQPGTLILTATSEGIGQAVARIDAR